MQIEALRTQYKNDILAIAARYKADNIRVFGSVARGDAHAESDIDFLVHFLPGASLLDEAGMDIALSELLDCKVDIIGDDVVREEFKPFIFNEAVPL